jgi:glyoxylase-like metal-dependent hydrolase (beta-lactamase superfamily II)
VTASALPAGIQVFERGWLSSNNIFLGGRDSCALVDSGYTTHADQTLALLENSLQGRPLDVLVNTHLHSDHCGGNAALQARYPDLCTWIPPGHASCVSPWDPVALTYVPTGQSCPPFTFDDVLSAGTVIRLGELEWQVHAAPGHDPHSLVFFEPRSRTLISADALWENGFGVVFPELEGEAAFSEVGATLDLIEQLAPQWVIPGHGPVFPFRKEVMTRARQRLDAFVQNPARHAHHAAKVLLKFKLLEQQQMRFTEFVRWAAQTSYFQVIRNAYFPEIPVDDWVQQLTDELVRSGVALRQGDIVCNA